MQVEHLFFSEALSELGRAKPLGFLCFIGVFPVAKRTCADAYKMERRSTSLPCFPPYLCLVALFRECLDTK